MNTAYIGKITRIDPIANADRIQSAEVFCGKGGTWRAVIRKDEFNCGDMCHVFLQDSLLPHTPEFSFLEQYGWRIKMRRFKGVPSEVLVLPKTTDGVVGDSIDSIVGVEKYEKPIPSNMGGEVLGYFPTNFIPKTDEPNFQTVPEMVAFMRGKSYYSTVKVDGSSATVYKWEGHFGCCSRNLELRDSPKNAIWQIAREYHLEDNLGDGWAVQFEVVGPGIQGNSLGLKRVEPRLFNVFDIPKHEYLNGEEVRIPHGNILPMVDIVDWNKVFDFQSDEELRKYAEGLYPNGHQREGVVIRPMTEARMDTGERVSMKAINLLYKD